MSLPSAQLQAATALRKSQRWGQEACDSSTFGHVVISNAVTATAASCRLLSINAVFIKGLSSCPYDEVDKGRNIALTGMQPRYVARHEDMFVLASPVCLACSGGGPKGGSS